MADDLDDLGFDPTLKKKKKKKKPFDLEAALEGTDAATEADPPTDAPVESPAPSKAEPEAVSKPAEEDDELNLDFVGLKKKKKKKKVISLDDDEPVTDASVPEAESKSEAPVADGDILDDDLGLDLTKKKKKKKKVVSDVLADIESEMNELNIDGEDDEDKETSDQISLVAWRPDSDRDYTYDELLQRVFEIMRQKNPDMVAGEKKKFVMRPPQVVRAGAKKTSFVNFTEICRLLHRQPKHLMTFLMAELGTSGSIDGTNQLVIKGRFQQKQIENVLRRYIKEYVTCHTCRSPETMLQRDTRLYFLQCETCGSRCSVSTIKSGFQAMTSKRAAARAKMN